MTDLLPLLARFLATPDDPALRGVFLDALEESGHLRQKWIILDLCPLCGSKLTPKRKRDNEDGVVEGQYDFFCKACDNQDVDKTLCRGEWQVKTSHFRVMRELGFVWCNGLAHYITRVMDSGNKVTARVDRPMPGIQCDRCHGLGIVRKR